MLRSHTHGHHPAGADLNRKSPLHADELKAISVIKPGTNTDKFSDKVYADVLS